MSRNSPKRLRYPGEVYGDLPGLIGAPKLPAGYKIRLVKNSRGTLWYTKPEKRFGWSKNIHKWHPRNVNLKTHWAIEVLAPNGRIAAAFGWVQKSVSVSTNGTYVAKKLRRRGIATALWLTMRTLTDCKVIYCQPISNGGFTLIESLREPLKLNGCIIRLKAYVTTDRLKDLREAA